MIQFLKTINPEFPSKNPWFNSSRSQNREASATSRSSTQDKGFALQDIPLLPKFVGFPIYHPQTGLLSTTLQNHQSYSSFRTVQTSPTPAAPIAESTTDTFDCAAAYAFADTLWANPVDTSTNTQPRPERSENGPKLSIPFAEVIKPRTNDKEDDPSEIRKCLADFKLPSGVSIHPVLFGCMDRAESITRRLSRWSSACSTSLGMNP